LPRLRVLFVEDNADEALLVRREIQLAGYEVEDLRVETAEDMRRALRTREWDLIISDFSMPRFTAPEALALLQESRLDIPFIIVSGTIGEDTAVASLKAGAHDFLAKGNLKRLIPALERELREAASRRERVKAEQRLNASEAALTAVFTASPLPIITLDLKARVTGWNPAAERVLGWTSEEVIGRLPPYLTEDVRDFQARFATVATGESLSGVEVTRARKVGAPIRMILSAAPLRDPSGNVSGAVAILTDISEQRALEEQFRQSQKMEAVGRLAGGIAHDFNNILTAIEGFAELLLTELPAESSQRQDLQEIMNAAQRAAAFTRQLLMFSRKQMTLPETLDVGQVIEGMRNLLSRVIGESYTLEIVADDQAPHVFADPGQIEQVVMNLVVNARDALPAGGTISISTRGEVIDVPDETATAHDAPAPGHYASLHVRDSGHGMTQETLSQVFDPFFTTKEPGKGTGLGLSTVYGIVKQSHGFIRVGTEVGRGTDVGIYWPADERERPVPTPRTMSQTRGPSTQHGGTILVVEDQAAIRSVIDRTLSRAGYTVLLVETAEEGLRMIEEQSAIQLLLTDVMLSGMTGIVLREKAIGVRPELKVVFMSGYSADEFPVGSGAAFLEKPFTPGALLACVNTALLDRQ
jgi:two-component system cell cycle sensor histidine kinase/response regulator CckA